MGAKDPVIIGMASGQQRVLGELQHLITRTSLQCLSRSSDTAPGLSEKRPSPSPDPEPEGMVGEEAPRPLG